ncbi:MAG: S8 family serine peptidase [Acidimicrobiales bacterium]
MGGVDDNGKPDWTDRVRFADNYPGGPFAFVPDQLLTGEPERARAKIGDLRGGREPGSAGKTGPVECLTDVGDVVRMVEDLRLENISAQPNHCLFTHASGGWQANPAYANPAYANPAYANPAYANPAYANPAYANPAYANPAYANPAYANPADPRRETGLRMSTARPAAPLNEVANQAKARIRLLPIEGCPRVVVLDTGLAGLNPPSVFADSQIVPANPSDIDPPDLDQNGLLDPAAGHGTFIAGLIRQVCPGVAVEVHKVLSGYGDGHEKQIADRILTLISDKRTILNLSFGGYVMDEPLAMTHAIRKFQDAGGVVVASAGNDGTCRPSYPAAIAGVVSVGAVGPLGPAGFSNWGPWVRACAPGVDLMSTFFEGFDGKGREPGPNGADPDCFNGWATWSGTSFAAPVVAAALARTLMMDKDCTATEAVERVVDGPDLLRLPGLGTVVNVM